MPENLGFEVSKIDNSLTNENKRVGENNVNKEKERSKIQGGVIKGEVISSGEELPANPKERETKLTLNESGSSEIQRGQIREQLKAASESNDHGRVKNPESEREIKKGMGDYVVENGSPKNLVKDIYYKRGVGMPSISFGNIGRLLEKIKTIFRGSAGEEYKNLIKPLYRETESLRIDDFWSAFGRPLREQPSPYVSPEYKNVDIKETRELSNNRVEYVFKYPDTDKFAGRVVVYKPYHKYFEYPLKDFVGESGKAFVEELTDIRSENEKSTGKKPLPFIGKESLPMIEEWRRKGEEIRTEKTDIKVGINPITGGFRRLIPMYSRYIDIKDERYWPNIKFPGRRITKRAVHEGDLTATISLMEKYNAEMFPPVMYVELPKGEYKFYGAKRVCDEYSDYSPAFLVFLMPEGRRLVDWGSRVIDRTVDKKYIERVASKTEHPFEEIRERIVKEPFKFMAQCHMGGYHLTDEWGTDAHYGNFFLSDKGNVINVSDIDDYKRHKSESGSVISETTEKAIYKEDINNLISRPRVGLYSVLRNLGVSKKDINNKYIPLALNTYLDTLEKEGASDIRALFTDTKSLHRNKEDREKFREYRRKAVNEFRQETYQKLEDNLEKLNLVGDLRQKWLKYYEKKLFGKKALGRIFGREGPQQVRAQIISRLQRKAFSEEQYDNEVYPFMIKSGIKIGKRLLKKSND